MTRKMFTYSFPGRLSSSFEELPGCEVHCSASLHSSRRTRCTGLHENAWRELNSLYFNISKSCRRRWPIRSRTCDQQATHFENLVRAQTHARPRPTRPGPRWRAGRPRDDRGTAARPEPVPRHHGVSCDRDGRRRLRRYGRLLDIRDLPRTCAGSMRSPTQTSRTGTPPRSAMTQGRIPPAMSGAVVARDVAARPRTYGAPTRLQDRRSTTMRFRSDHKMPAPKTASRTASLRMARRSPSRSRRPGSGLLPGGITVFDWTDLDHSEGDRLLRSRPFDSSAHVLRRLLVGLLVQWRDREAPRLLAARHLRAGAESPHLGEWVAAAKNVHWESEDAGPTKDLVAAEASRARALPHQLERDHPSPPIVSIRLRCQARGEESAPSGRTRSTLLPPRCTVKPTA